MPGGNQMPLSLCAVRGGAVSYRLCAGSVGDRLTLAAAGFGRSVAVGRRYGFGAVEGVADAVPTREALRICGEMVVSQMQTVAPRPPSR